MYVISGFVGTNIITIRAIVLDKSLYTEDPDAMPNPRGAH